MFHLALESVVEVRPRQTSVLVCVVTGTSEELADPRVHEGAHCRRCGTG